MIFTCRLAISRSAASDMSTTMGSASWLPTVMLEAALSPTITLMVVSAGAGIATVTVAVPLAGPDVAVTAAAPSATAVTRPVGETVATDADDELHETLAPLIAVPSWPFTSAESCCVAPIEVKLKLAGETVTEVAVGGVVGEFPPSPHPVSTKTAVSV